MHTKLLLQLFLMTGAAAAATSQEQPQIQEPLAKRILDMSEADQIAYLNGRLNEGLRPVPDDAVGVLMSARSALALPIIEAKIESVVKSSNPKERFTDELVDAQRFVDVAASMISSVGDTNALQAIGRLVELNEKRFGGLIRATLLSAQNRRNPFVVAYRGFDIRNPAVDRAILSWAEEQFGDETEFWRSQVKQWWAEAMIEKYHHRPTETDWHFDPIASRIKRQLVDPLHDDVIRLAAETYEKRAKEK